MLLFVVCAASVVIACAVDVSPCDVVVMMMMLLMMMMVMMLFIS